MIIDNRYRVIKKIGEGNFGIVYLVEDTRSRLVVALKLLKRAEDFSGRFAREFSLMSTLSHPRIIALYEYGTFEGKPYFTMEFLDGENLEIARKPMPAGKVARIIYEIADGLFFLHNQGIVHRDLKPSNIFMTAKGIKLFDFGLMCEMGKDVQTITGTLPYIAPEILDGEPADFYSDFYSLGVVALELLGITPFVGSASEIIEKKFNFRLNEFKIPDELAPLLQSLLSSDRFERPKNASQIKSFLAPILGVSIEKELPLTLPETKFIGRKNELNLILSTIERGGYTKIFVSGESGIGKTRLLKEARAIALTRNFKVIEAKGGELIPDLAKLIPSTRKLDIEGTTNLITLIASSLKTQISGETLLFVNNPSSDEIRLIDELGKKLGIVSIVELEEAPEGLKLLPLSEPEIKELVLSILGNVSNVDELVEFLRFACDGNPGKIRETLIELIRAGAFIPAKRALRFEMQKTGKLSYADIVKRKLGSLSSSSLQALKFIFASSSGLPLSFFDHKFGKNNSAKILTDLILKGLVKEIIVSRRTLYKASAITSDFFQKLEQKIYKQIADYLVTLNDTFFDLEIAKNYRACGLNELALPYSLRGANSAREALKFDEAYMEYLFLAEQVPQDKAKYLKLAGLMRRQVGDYESALELYTKALEVAKSTNNRDLVIKTLNDLGVVEFDRGELENAESYYAEALKFAKNDSEKLLLMNNIASLVAIRGRWKKALDLYSEALDVAERIGNFKLQAILHLNIGEAYQIVGNYEKAELEFRSGCTLARKRGYKQYLAQGLVLLGNLYRLQFELALAERSLDEAEAIVKDNPPPEIEVMLSLTRAGILENKGKTLEAKELLDGIKTGDLSHQLKNEYYRRLALVSFRERDFKKLMWLVDKLDELHDNLRSELFRAICKIESGEKINLSDILVRFEERKGEEEFPLLCIYMYKTTGKREYLDLAINAPSNVFRDEAEKLMRTKGVSQFELFISTIRELDSTLEPQKLLKLIVDKIVEITGTERGVLLLEESGELTEVVAKGEIERYSKSIVNEVYKTGKPKIAERILEDEELSMANSIVDLQLKSAICVPIRIEEKVRGVIYADARYAPGRFSEEELYLVSALAEQAGLALEKAYLVKNLAEENIALKREREKNYRWGNIIGRSEAMQEIFKKLELIADRDVSVLLLGETGTGKDMIARAIHYASHRKDGPFVAINCAALPENLLESELFGYEKGAFTGALRSKIGKFELANNGTLFLDEIGDLPLFLQAKLLQVLETQTFQHLGGVKDIKVNVRIISATNRNIEELIAQRLFREDLYFRLATVKLKLPPLRERKSDIPILVEHFLKEANRRFGKDVKGVDPEAMRMLMEYDYPGNVRELQILLDESVLFSHNNYITPESLPESVRKGKKEDIFDFPGNLAGLKEAKRRICEDLEKRVIERLLEENGWNITRASKAFGIHRTRLHQLMSKYGIRKVRNV